MADFNVRSDAVDVEHIMQQIRARIREKRGVDYTEQQIRELATVKLERFLDPDGIRSNLLEQFHRARATSEPLPGFEFEETTLYQSHRMPILQSIRKLLNPILKLFFNPNPLIQALHIQSQLNRVYSNGDALYFELIHNLVVELTRLSIEVKNLKMRVESVSSRLDFDERRARALEGVVQYRPGAGTGMAAAATPAVHAARAEDAERPVQADQPGDGPRNRRRRRRRGRRGGASQFGAPPDPTRTETASGTGSSPGVAPGSSASSENKPHGDTADTDADRGGPASSAQ